MCVRIAWSLHEPRKGLSMADFQVGSIEFWNRRLKFLKFFKEKNPQKSLFSEHQHQWTHIQFQQKNRIKSCFLYFVFTYERLFLLFITPTASLASYSHCRSWRLVGTSCDFRLGPHLGVRHWLETTLSKLESDFGVISEEVEKTHWCWSIVLECFGWFSCTDVVWSKDFKVIYVIYIYMINIRFGYDLCVYIYTYNYNALYLVECHHSTARGLPLVTPRSFSRGRVSLDRRWCTLNNNRYYLEHTNGWMMNRYEFE